MTASKTRQLAHRAIRCAGKRVYASWEAAEAAALVLIEDLFAGKLPRQKDGAILAYRCDVCARWHIGHCGCPDFSGIANGKRFKAQSTSPCKHQIALAFVKADVLFEAVA